jgi:hypothetical protein
MTECDNDAEWTLRHWGMQRRLWLRRRLLSRICSRSWARILQRDREIPLEDLPKLAKYLLNEAGLTPNKRIEVTGNLVPHPQDLYSLTNPAFVIACRPLNKRP